MLPISIINNLTQLNYTGKLKKLSKNAKAAINAFNRRHRQENFNPKKRRPITPPNPFGGGMFDGTPYLFGTIVACTYSPPYPVNNKNPMILVLYSGIHVRRTAGTIKQSINGTFRKTLQPIHYTLGIDLSVLNTMERFFIYELIFQIFKNTTLINSIEFLNLIKKKININKCFRTYFTYFLHGRLISQGIFRGLPPSRIFFHPDKQIQELNRRIYTQITRNTITIPPSNVLENSLEKSPQTDKQQQIFNQNLKDNNSNLTVL